MERTVIQQLRDPVFKGCTRPAMLAGVPLIPLVLICGVALPVAMWASMLSFWLAFVVIVAVLVLIVVMRQITHGDDHRLSQLLLRLRLRARHGNVRHWGAASYTPTRYKRRST